MPQICVNAIERGALLPGAAFAHRLSGESMRTILSSAVVAAGLLFSFNSFAAAPADAPTGSTGLCKDGTYYSGKEKKGACSGHNGVKTWWGDSSAANTATKTDAKAATPAAPAAQATAAPATTAAAPAKTEAPKPAATPAPGGGPGKVWANDSTKVYHCPADKYYGKTKKGEYMSEADAKSKGFKPDHGKACSTS
jgi:hypothetical protein